MELAHKFVENQGRPGTWHNHPMLFYVWGHTYEYGYNKERNNWEYCEEFCKKISGHEDSVWYATNIEIYDYLECYNLLQTSLDCKYIYNPTAKTIYFCCEAGEMEIKPGETINLR